MSKNDQSPSQGSVSVIFNPTSIAKLKASGYLAACDNDMQKVADTIVDFGVSRWSALSKHSEKKGRGSLIPGERKTRGGVPGSPRKPKATNGSNSRAGIEAEIAKATANGSQTVIPGADASKDEPKAAKASKATASAAKPATPPAKAAATGGNTPPKAAPAAAPAKAKPKPSGKSYVVHFNPHKQTYVAEKASSEKDAIEEAIANVPGLKAAKIIRVSVE